MTTGGAGLPTRLVCSGCDAPSDGPLLPPFSCPRASPGDGVDHVLRRVLDTSRVAFPHSSESNPFIAYRSLLHSYQLARAAGLSDDGFVRIARDLDRRIADLDGHGFERTPCREETGLADALGHSGRLSIKNETAGVSGSHKARHMMGLMLYLEAYERMGLGQVGRPLAISSCGNAALAAAVVARAAQRPLKVFVPPSADAHVLARLTHLGAEVTVCPRTANEPGDPCTARFREEVARGAIPFSCQGSDNGLVIEGGMTLGYELLSEHRAQVDRLFVQVGGGALASACVQSLEEGRRWGLLRALPRVYAVQTEGAAPLLRAYLGVSRRVLARLGRPNDLPPLARPSARLLDEVSRMLARPESQPLVREELAYAARHRAEFMWPWESEPRSAAHGILDDETYDWLAIVEGMLASGGHPLVVDERQVARANELGRRHTGIAVDATGTAGLAGLLALDEQLGRPAQGPSSLVLFTGKDRRGS